jgi:hypothetical protein
MTHPAPVGGHPFHCNFSTDNPSATAERVGHRTKRHDLNSQSGMKPDSASLIAMHEN